MLNWILFSWTSVFSWILFSWTSVLSSVLFSWISVLSWILFSWTSVLSSILFSWISVLSWILFSWTSVLSWILFSGTSVLSSILFSWISVLSWILFSWNSVFSCCRAVAQVVSRRRLSAEAHVRFQASACDICSTETGFSTSTSLVSVIPPVLHTHLSTTCIRRTWGWRLWKKGMLLRLVWKVAKSVLASSCQSVCSHGTIEPPLDIKFNIWAFFRNSVEKIKVSLKSETSNGYFT